MNKRIKQAMIALAVCIGLFVGITPKIIGIGIQQAFNSDLLEQIPAQAKDHIIVTDSLLDSGWFQSFVSLDIEYNAPELNEIFSAAVQFDIDHGPFILDENKPRFGLANAKIKLSSNNAAPSQTLSQAKLELPSLIGSVFIGLNQSFSVTAEISPANFENNIYRINFEGVNGNFVIHPDRSAHATISVGQFHANNVTDNIELSISSLEIEFTSEDLNQPAAPSEVSLIVPLVTASGSTQFSAKDIFANFQVQNSSVNQQLINITQNLRLREIKSNLPLTSLSWTSEINEIQNEIIKSYSQMFLTLRPQTNKDPIATIAQATQLGEKMSLLIAQNNIVLNNFIQTNLYGGEHNVDLKVNWQGLPNLTDLNDLNLEDAIYAMRAQLNISLDKNAIENSQFAPLIEQYIAQNYLVDDNGKLILNGKLQNNELIFNGTTTSLEDFFQ